MTNKPLERFTNAYIECALWASTEGDDAGTPLNHHHDSDDIAPETLAGMRNDCAAFYLKHEMDIFEKYKHASEHDTDELAGHDFWLTRCGHGAGFWDGDWAEPHATAMDKTASEFGDVDLYVGDDGLIYA